MAPTRVGASSARVARPDDSPGGRVTRRAFRIVCLLFWIGFGGTAFADTSLILALPGSSGGAAEAARTTDIGHLISPGGPKP